MNTHAGSTPLPNVAVHELSQLEQETFALKMKQLEYDVQACRVAKAKKQTWELQVHHTKLQFRVKAHEEAVKSAKVFMNDWCKIVTYTNSDDLTRNLQAFMMEKTQKLKLDESGNATRQHYVFKPVVYFWAKRNPGGGGVGGVPFVPFHQKCQSFFFLPKIEAALVYLNWSAPSTLKNATRSAQCAAASFVLGSSPKAVGLLLQPEFTYKRGDLWLLENSIMKQLAQSGIQLDKSFTLQFKEKAFVL